MSYYSMISYLIIFTLSYILGYNLTKLFVKNSIIINYINKNQIRKSIGVISTFLIFMGTDIFLSSYTSNENLSTMASGLLLGSMVSILVAINKGAV